mgnify:CR=1 FL=1
MKFCQKPSQEESGRVPPVQHLAKGFPVLNYCADPEVSIEEWEFRIWGLAKPTVFKWSDILALPQNECTVDFNCVTR